MRSFIYRVTEGLEYLCPTKSEFVEEIGVMLKNGENVPFRKVQIEHGQPYFTGWAQDVVCIVDLEEVSALAIRLNLKAVEKTFGHTNVPQGTLIDFIRNRSREETV